ncbi:MAG: protein-L-isoaspartate(D-aspartate) O-methyltransferase [Candidatus Aminicenantes bacterium]|nr:protein-L-isoaspartate(D-aspartate) O-methyltransferase [Candidatus Aminicenantes bacterium]
MKPTYFLMIPALIFFCLLPCRLQAGEPDYALLQKKMTAEQIVGRGITDQRLLTAFEKVKRHLFVKPSLRAHAYDDSPLDIGEGQSISEPYIVAVMTAAVAPTPGKKVLEIGTGSGYHAAILAELVKNVYTIELIEKLGKDAQTLLDSLGYKNIHFKIGDGYKGWEQYAPYDGIIVTCSEDHIPEPLIKQLAVGGRLIIPVRYSSKVQELIMIEKEEDGELKKTYLIPAQFVPLIRGNEER